MPKFDKKGLIPAIIQDVNTGQILMLGYMNEESLQITKESGRVCFWSRSRQELWTKGGTSGNFLNVTNIFIDCDEDAILIHANPVGPTCHTGNQSCFYRKLNEV